MKIVCIGGGHGLSQVLEAISTLATDLTAIVTTTDNGGSTGRLRQDENLIAVGDIRRCVNALANQNNILSMLSEQRFNTKNDLNGHCFGNVLLAALCQITNSPSDAVKIFCTLLGVEQTVLPMSNSPVDLVATTSTHKEIFGECEIDRLNEFPASLSLSKKVLANPQAVDAIKQADLVLLGPGSLLTSVLPPLLLPEVKQALQDTSGCRIFIENLVPERSAVDNIPGPEQARKACQLLGYKFFDLCLTPDAFEAMDLRAIEQVPHNGVHDKSQLHYIIEQLLPYSKSVDDKPQTKVH